MALSHCVSLHALLLLAALAGWAGEPPPKKVEAAKDNLRLTVEFPKQLIAGENITVTIAATNIGKESVPYGFKSRLRKFRISLKDGDGRPVPFSKFGSALVEMGDDLSTRGRKLEPGETMSVSYNLSRVFDLGMAGTYFLGVQMPFRILMEGGDTVEVKDAKFEVAEPEDK